MADCYVGEIRMFAGLATAIPTGWLPCDGRYLNVSDYELLFTALYYTYGGSQTTFALPDLRGRVPISCGQSTASYHTYLFGAIGGATQMYLNRDNLPNHNHTVQVNTKANSPAGSPYGAYLGGVSGKKNQLVYATPDSSYTGACTLDSSTISAGAPGNLPVSNIQPSLCVNYIIATYGAWPSPAPSVQAMVPPEPTQPSTPEEDK
ncbi:MAG: phage tail protein [Alphaproteobacteria bacterium]|nr:MAG: phage tail protein [Alphaproteobacteria bacterium]